MTSTANSVGTARSDVNQAHPAPEPVDRAKLELALIAYRNRMVSLDVAVNTILSLQSGERS